MIEYVATWLQLKIDALKTDRRAVTAMEYGLIAALVAVVIITAVTTLGKNIGHTFDAVSGKLKSS